VRFALLLAGVVVFAVAPLQAPPSSTAAEPPNQNDPCSTGGKDTCGTTGVGYYKTYRYGIRWFGDYRGVVPGVAHLWCIDLRYWYPSAAHRYREESGVLKNRDGETIPVGNQQRLAYAIWNYGRSSNANQAAAVMLYVHTLMGDAAPGEVSPSALGPAVVALYDRIADEAARYHGPYRIDARLPGGLNVGDKTQATIRVLSAAGNALPNLGLTLSATGASGFSRRVQTDKNGVARVELQATSAADIRLTVQTDPLASNLPTVYRATTPAAAPNSQRVAAPTAQRVTDTVTATVSKNRIAVSTAAAPARLLVGAASRDKVTIKGAAASWNATVTVRIYGPFASADAIVCNQAPVFESSFKANGSGTFTTPPATFTAPGWYTYREVVPGDANHIGLTTPCGVASESFRVEVQPRLSSIISAQRVTSGTAIFDRVLVAGLSDQHVTVQAALYGPFATRQAITCDNQPIWRGPIDVTADGSYQTDPFTLTVPGFYTYKESIAAAGFVRAAQTVCGDTSETTTLPGQPTIGTQVSTQQARIGASITDKVVVKGLGVLEAPVRVELWGPFATRGAIGCSGTPYWKGSFVAKGDGTYTTAPVQIVKAGYYTYREAIVETASWTGFASPCAEVAETTFAKARPSVTTLVSAQIVRPGAKIFDRIRVRGLGQTPAAIEVKLFGPFATRSAISCSGTPYWQGQVTAKGDGELSSPSVTIAKVGFYTYRERLVGSPLVDEVTTECAVEAETSLGAPQIITGRGDIARFVRARDAGARTPTRVRIESVGIDAPVSPVGIDIPHGVLGAPTHISRLGFWTDGMAPGARSGSILIDGHVDSATAGAGAFFRLHEAKSGDRVHVLTRGGKTYTYRVVSVRNYPKSALPTSVYSRTGQARLVLVTCGGPFIQAAGHYRDNVVLTAVPA
jgi:Sortase domain